MKTTTTVRIERLGAKGDGIAPGPVFVDGALPGEVVEGEVGDQRIAAPRIIEPSPDRVKAPCPHAASCGGCTLQHASNEFIALWKEESVRKALSSAGVNAPFRPISTSAPRTRRRAKLAARRTKKGVQVGFRARRSELIVEIPECCLLCPEIMKGIPAIADAVRAGGSRKGTMEFAVTATETGLDVHAIGGKPLDLDLRESLGRIASDHRLARLTWNEELIAMETSPRLTMGHVSMVPPPNSFLQATPEGEGALGKSVEEAVGGAATIADLFSGSGTFALRLLPQAAVHAVEVDQTALDALQSAWRKAGGLHPLTVEMRNLFRDPLSADELAGFEAAVIDPPRAGAEAQAQALAGSSIPQIASVSCNPQTFARDAAHLVAGGYRMEWVQVVDQFRWSPHIEVVASFLRHR